MHGERDQPSQPSLARTGAVPGPGAPRTLQQRRGLWHRLEAAQKQTSSVSAGLEEKGSCHGTGLSHHCLTPHIQRIPCLSRNLQKEPAPARCEVPRRPSRARGPWGAPSAPPSPLG